MENRPADWAWVSPSSEVALSAGDAGVEFGVAVAVTVGVTVGVGTVPSVAAGACKLNGLASAISRITAKNGTVAIRHLAVKGKVNMDPAIGLRNLRRRCPHLSE